PWKIGANALAADATEARSRAEPWCRAGTHRHERSSTARRDSHGREPATVRDRGTITKVYNNSWICQDGTSYNQPRIQVLAQTLQATPVKISNGKQITGWNLTGVGSTKALSD